MKKRMLSLLLAVALVLGLCPGVFAAGSSYADVLDTHWAHPYIEDVTEKGIMNGVDDKELRAGGCHDARHVRHGPCPPER